MAQSCWCRGSLPFWLPCAADSLLDKLFATVFRLHRMTRSAAVVFANLLLVCSLANTTCAITNIVTALIFVILIVSRLHAFFLVVAVCSFLQVLTVVAVNSYFQHPDASGTFLAWTATRLGSLSVSHNKLALNHLPVRSKQIEFSFVVPIIRDTRKLHKLI